VRHDAHGAVEDGRVGGVGPLQVRQPPLHQHARPLLHEPQHALLQTWPEHRHAVPHCVLRHLAVLHEGGGGGEGEGGDGGVLGALRLRVSAHAAQQRDLVDGLLPEVGDTVGGVALGGGGRGAGAVEGCGGALSAAQDTSCDCSQHFELYINLKSKCVDTKTSKTW